MTHGNMLEFYGEKSGVRTNHKLEYRYL